MGEEEPSLKYPVSISPKSLRTFSMSVFRDILVCGKQLSNRPLIAGFDSKQSILGKARAVGKAEKTFVSQIQDLITM